MRTGHLIVVTFLATFFTMAVLQAGGQENGPVLIQGRRYLDCNIRSLERYNRRAMRTQRQLLNRLARKERRLAGKLRRTDSVAYASFQAQTFSFDSIRKLALHPDSATWAARVGKAGDRTIDTLKGVYRFLQGKAGQATAVLQDGKLNEAAKLSGYDKQLSTLQQSLNYNQYINELTDKQALSLEGITGSGNTLGITKEAYYGRSKLKEWQKLAEEPDRLEAKALEYLQGTKGFNESLNQSSSNGSSPMGSASVEDLEKMGFQTKRQITQALSQKFGSGLQNVQGNLDKQVGDWQDKAQHIQKGLKETAQTLRSIKAPDKPNFRINPMRGKPFWMRMEKQYSFNTRRASALTDGTRQPAVLSLSAGLAYKQSPRLKAGLGISADIGLGQSWSSIKFSFEGLGARVFTGWEWQYGIGVYGGYERTYNPHAVFGLSETSGLTRISGNYATSVLLGLTKTYNINSKWKGAIQLLFDTEWKHKGLSNPIVLRFLNSK